jgi:hypothetical protein
MPCLSEYRQQHKPCPRFGALIYPSLLYRDAHARTGVGVGVPFGSGYTFFCLERLARTPAPQRLAIWAEECPIRESRMLLPDGSFNFVGNPPVGLCGGLSLPSHLEQLLMIKKMLDRRISFE